MSYAIPVIMKLAMPPVELADARWRVKNPRQLFIPAPAGVRFEPLVSESVRPGEPNLAERELAGMPPSRPFPPPSLPASGRLLPKYYPQMPRFWRRGTQTHQPFDNISSR